MCTYFKTETEDHSSRKNIWGYGVRFWKNGSFVYAELKETVEAATSNYSATGEFLRHIYSVLVAKNHQNIRSRCLVDEFSFTDFFLNSILYGCCFLSLLWKGAQNDVHCNCVVSTSLSIFILLQLQSWIILRVRTKFLFRNFIRREWLCT